eukprot:4663750-Karenia_brevis.AAC.1
MERRRARAAAERENLRVAGRRPRDDWVQQQVDHYRLTGKAWVDFDPIDEMTDADLDNLFDNLPLHKKAKHRNFITYVAGSENDRVERR